MTGRTRVGHRHRRRSTTHSLLAVVLVLPLEPIFLGEPIQHLPERLLPRRDVQTEVKEGVERVGGLLAPPADHTRADDAAPDAVNPAGVLDLVREVPVESAGAVGAVG